MEKATRRERKKQETRRRILDVCFRLFVQQGFERTTVDQIAAEADIGKGTFYNYFASKEGALYEFMEDLGRQRGKKIWPRIIKLPDTRQRLAAAFRSLTSWFEEYPELLRVYTLDRMTTGLKDPANFKPDHFELFLEEILKLGQEMGDIRDDIAPDQMVNYLMGITLIQFYSWFETGAGSGLYELAIQGVDFFLIGALSTDR